MSTFDVLTVGERRLQALFDDLPAQLEARLASAMERIAARMLAAVQAAEPERTGKLRRETHSFVHRGSDAIIAGVTVEGDSKVDLGKAAALEYGAHRPTTVAEHWATRSNFWGRETAPESVLIEQYSRRVNISADRYLRDPFAALQESIITEIEAAVDESVVAADR